MVKKIFVMLFCSVCLIIFVSTLYAQGSKNTLTLPNGDVVLDLNGEWDCYTVNHGPWASEGSSSDVIRITQSGSSFVGVRMRETPMMKGTEAIRGELDKRGIKWVQLDTAQDPLSCVGKISEDGNKMVIDDGQRQKRTFTRK